MDYEIFSTFGAALSGSNYVDWPPKTKKSCRDGPLGAVRFLRRRLLSCRILFCTISGNVVWVIFTTECIADYVTRI